MNISTILNHMSWLDIVGFAGVGLVIFAYFMIQKGAWHHQLLRLPLTNLAGASLILLSLIDKPNPSAILIESVWVLISLYGVWHVLKHRNIK